MVSLFRLSLSPRLWLQSLFVLFSVDNALMRSCVKNAPQAPINVNLSSSQQQAAFSKGLREHSSPYFSSPRSFFFEGNSRSVGFSGQRPGESTEAWPSTPCRCCDFYTAGIVSSGCACLASAEWTPVAAVVRTAQQLYPPFSLKKIHCLDKKINNKQSSPLKICTSSSVLILRRWTVTTTMSASATFTAVTPLSSELRVKLELWRRPVQAAFKIKASDCCF